MPNINPMTSFVTGPNGEYTRVAAVLHWVVAALILANLLFGLTADAFPEDWIRPVIDLHKSIGLTVLGLVIPRILWRLSHPPPAFPASYSRLEKAAAHFAHGALYLLIVLMPVSGWLHDSAFKDAAAHPLRIFWVIPWFRIGAIEHLDPATKERLHSVFFVLHAGAAFVLMGLLALHILGALKHQFIDREPELQRMRIGRRPRPRA